MPPERRWVESGCKLSTVLQCFTMAEAWCFLLGTGTVALTTHLPITHRLNIHELTSGACDAIFKVPGEMKKTIPSASPPPCTRLVEQAEGRDS